MKNKIKILARILFGGLILFGLFFKIGLDKIVESLAHLNLWALPLAIGFFVMFLWLSSLGSWVLLRAFSPLSFREFLPCYFPSWAIGLFLPETQRITGRKLGNKTSGIWLYSRDELLYFFCRAERPDFGVQNSPDQHHGNILSPYSNLHKRVGNTPGYGDLSLWPTRSERSYRGQFANCRMGFDLSFWSDYFYLASAQFTPQPIRTFRGTSRGQTFSIFFFTRSSIASCSSSGTSNTSSSWT